MKLLFSRLLTPASVSVFDQSIISASNFGIGVLLARIFGLELFGQFALVISLGSIVQQGLYYLLTAPMMSFSQISRYTNRGYLKANSHFTFQLPLLAVPIVFLTLFFIYNSLDLTLGVALTTSVSATLFLMTSSIQDNLRRVHFTQGAVSRPVFLDCVRYLGSFLIVAVVYFAQVKLTIIEFLLIFSLVNTLSIGLSDAFRWSSDDLKKNHRSFFRRKHWHFGKWFLVSVLMTALSDQMLLIAVGVFVAIGDVSLWRGALYIIGLFNPVLLAMENFIPIQASRIFNSRGKSVSIRYLYRSLAILIGVFLVPLILVGYEASKIMTLVLGPDFATHPETLQVACFAFILNLPRMHLQYYLRASNQTKKVFQGNLFGVIVTGILLIFFHKNLVGFQLSGIAGQLATIAGLFVMSLEKKWAK